MRSGEEDGRRAEGDGSSGFGQLASGGQGRVGEWASGQVGKCKMGLSPERQTVVAKKSRLQPRNWNRMQVRRDDPHLEWCLSPSSSLPAQTTITLAQKAPVRSNASHP